MHAYLDANDALLSDPAWISLNYGWLIDQLRIAEQSAWLGDEPRGSIREFRLAIDRKWGRRRPAGHRLARSSGDGTGSPVCVQEHGRLELSQGVTYELGGAGLRKKAPKQRLCPVYCRAAQSWQHCISLIAYAPRRKAVRIHLLLRHHHVVMRQVLRALENFLENLDLVVDRVLAEREVGVIVRKMGAIVDP